MRAALLAAVLVLALPVLGQTGSAPDPVFQIDFTNPSLVPSHWTLTLHPDGSGHFLSEPGTAQTSTIEAPAVNRDIQVSAGFAQRVFDTAHKHRLFNEACESHIKQVSFRGWKRLSYSGPDGKGSCVYNYSKDQKIDDFGESLLAVASTIVEGARLELLLQHDRLGLDKEMEYLVEAAGDGRVQELGAIRGILERLATDESVLERVRTRATQLLARAEI
jgi:hypothetical protein